MPALAAPRAKAAAKNAPDHGASPKALRKRSRRPNGAGPVAIGVLQPKLHVNDPNDQFEREADRVADRVMSMPEPKPRRSERDGRDREEGEPKLPLQRQEAEEEEEQTQSFSLQRRQDEESEEELAQTASLQRQQEEEEEQAASMQRQEMEEETEEEEVQTFSLQRQEEEEEEQAQTSSLQRRTAEEEEEQMQQRAKHLRRPRITPRFETDLQLMRRGGGQPLPEPLRAFLEPRFGRSFADIRVHAGPEAAKLARAANARAFTVGKHIVFGAGEYRPGIEQGRRLIAHELTHVLQQRGGLHSVQREIGPERAGAGASQADLPSIEELRAAFDLDSATAPPSVLNVAVDLLQAALLSPSNAVRLKPFMAGDSETAALVRRIVSGAYTLELTALRSGGGVETGWKLTHRAKRQTFASNSVARHWPGGTAIADGDTIMLTAPPTAGQYAGDTIAAGLESTRTGDLGRAERPTPPLPESIPAGSVPSKAPTVAAPVPQAEAVPAGPVAEPVVEAAEVPAEPLSLAQPTEGAAEPAAQPAVSEPSEQEGGEPAAEPERAPVDPQEDPEFQQTLGQISRTRKAQGAHRPSAAKLEETKQAAVLPPEQQRDGNDRNQHLKEIGAVAEQSKQVTFTPKTFKALLAKSLAAIQLPENESQAKRFKREKPLEAAKENIRSQVKDQNQKIAGPLTDEIKTTEPPPSNLPVQGPAELEEEGAGKKPRPISPTAGAPKPRLDSEISMEKESTSLDELMTEHDLTEEQLAESNEPTFIQALDTKQEAQKQAADAPGRFREQEEQVLAQAQAKAGHAGAAKFGGMFETREGAFTEVFTAQDSTAREDKSEQDAVHTELKRIYTSTKTNVDGILTSLSASVDDIFSTEVDQAKQTFEKTVEDKLDDIYGFTVIDDWLFGEDTEAIEDAFRVEKERFLATMDGVLDRIAVLIADQLNAAIERIGEGRSEAERFFKSLSEDQQKLSQEAFELFNTQFDILEDGVRDKQQELAETLAESYKTNVDALRESFDKIKDEVSKGWIGKAVEFIVDVATVIAKLAELLWSVLSRIGNVIGDILRHPIRFIENLAEGVGAGFKKFIDKIDEYLAAGFFDWLRGTVGGPGIKLPDKFDAAGIFSLVTQVVGLTYETFRKVASKVWGKAAVELLEKGAAVAEKGLELFHIVREKGLGGLWEHIKETIGSHVDELMTKIKETVLYETIKKALAFIATLFTPAGAFIKAAQAIYAGIRFLVDNIDRIADVVNAFLSSVELAVAGKTDAISQRIVTALRGFIVLGIDFLAKLLRLGNLDDKVRKILKAVRRPVERAMEAVLKRLRPLVRSILKRFGVGVEDREREGGRPLGREDVVTQVVRLMEQPAKATTPTAALTEKKAQAQSLLTKYQPMLKKGQLRIVITDPTATEVEQDAAVDFEVSASPGKTGEAPVPIKVKPIEDKDVRAIQQRFAHARSLKKFTAEKGFALADWASTFTNLSQSTHQKDMQFGVRSGIIQKQEATYHFEVGVPKKEIVNRGALELQNEGRNHLPFQGGRFGVPLIQAFLSGRKIAGVPPDSFGDRGIVSQVAVRTESAGAIKKVGKTSTWALPEIPMKRTLPAGWGGVTHVRPRYYERGAGFPRLADDFAQQVIDAEIVPLIEEQLDNIREAKKKGVARDMTPWQTMLARGLAKPGEKFSAAAAKADVYYDRGRYDVDHVKPLAGHWNQKGHNSDQSERIAATQGKRGNLQLLESSVNRSKGSGGITYQLWVGPSFTSPGGDQFHADPGERFKEFP